MEQLKIGGKLEFMLQIIKSKLLADGNKIIKKKIIKLLIRNRNRKKYQENGLKMKMMNRKQ